MNQNDDWRLYKGQIEYLYKTSLLHHAYTPCNSNIDHDHCEFCMAKFGTNLDELNYGYSTVNNYTWICEDCYNDFKEMFKWNVMETNK